jgi:hypothetical protein
VPLSIDACKARTVIDRKAIARSENLLSENTKHLNYLPKLRRTTLGILIRSCGHAEPKIQKYFGALKYCGLYQFAPVCAVSKPLR